VNTDRQQMRARRPSWVARSLTCGLVASALFFVWAGCGIENSLVDGECRLPLKQCGLTCVDLANDPRNCGSCSINCPDACANGVCVSGDASINKDGGRDALSDGPLSDGPLSDGSGDGQSDARTDGGRDGSLPDGGLPDGNVPDGSTDGSNCMPPFDRVDQCGSCSTRCNADEVCEPDGASFICAPKCKPPRTVCGSDCVDLQTDPVNCGVCSKFCTSFICAGGVCQGRNPGSIVTIGHDYSTRSLNVTSQERVLANAVFLPSTNPLRVLIYEQGAQAASIQNVRQILAATSGGRVINYRVPMADSELAAADLIRSYDVVLVHDLGSKTDATLGALGDSWNAPLNQFAKRGGIVVALDGASGMGSMRTLISRAGFLDISGHTRLLPLVPVTVTAASDSVAAQVLSPYAAFDRSVSFQSNEPNTSVVTWVVRSGPGGTGDPVVVHKNVE
jgi:hypothetical protein